jgi:hypothetical protein
MRKMLLATVMLAAGTYQAAAQSQPAVDVNGKPAVRSKSTTAKPAAKPTTTAKTTGTAPAKPTTTVTTTAKPPTLPPKPTAATKTIPAVVARPAKPPAADTPLIQKKL